MPVIDSNISSYIQYDCVVCGFINLSEKTNKAALAELKGDSKEYFGKLYLSLRHVDIYVFQSLNRNSDQLWE